MSRIASFVVLLAVLLLIAGLFVRVIATFLLPMFLAVLLVVMFGPLHRWFIDRCKGRDRLAAGLTTAAILLILLIPVAMILVPAIHEGMELVAQHEWGRTEAPSDDAADRSPPPEASATPESDNKEPSAADGESSSVNEMVAGELAGLGNRIGIQLAAEDIERTINSKLQQWLAPAALTTTQYVARFLIGIGVMTISLYYFLADGPGMIRTVMRLSPLEDKYEQQLIAQFDDMTRAVVVATLLSAFVQGILAGIGFFIAGVEYVYLLTTLSMLLAMVPFVGAAAVWVPVCLWLFFFDNSPVTAVLLAIYGGGVISMADNVIKPMVLHGRANLHPLLALLSVLGGVQALGPIGIFVGPMVVAFLQTLLNMLQVELASMSGGKVREESSNQ